MEITENTYAEMAATTLAESRVVVTYNGNRTHRTEGTTPYTMCGLGLRGLATVDPSTPVSCSKCQKRTARYEAMIAT